MSRDRDVLFTNLKPPPDELPEPADLGSPADATHQASDHPTARRRYDGAVYKYVTAAATGSPRIVQVGQPIPDTSPVSPRFDDAL